MEILGPILDVVRNAALFLLIITVLVAVHELGHYLFARWCGMHVDAFAVMMGGVRRTDLTPHLKAPLKPAWMPWAAGIASVVAFALGSVLSLTWVAWAGLAVFAMLVPTWVAARLEKLYHLDQAKGPIYVAAGWLAGLAVLFLGTRFQGVTPEMVFGTMAAGGWTGMLIVYYWPVIARGEEGVMGRGSILTPPDEQERAEHAEAMTRAGLAGHGDAEPKEIPVRFRPLWHWTNREGTEFSILALPLGGFAAIRGMHPKEDGSETKIEGGFFSRPAWQRWLVLFAGPLFSVLFGILVLTASISAFGVEEPDGRPVVGGLGAGMPAEKAGLKPGDMITAINGEPVEEFADVVDKVSGRVTQQGDEFVSEPLQVTFERNGDSQTIELTPEVSDGPQPVLNEDGSPTGEMRRRAILGISPATRVVQKAPLEALQLAAMQPVRLAMALASVAAKPSEAKNVVGGPVSMASGVAQAADGGVRTVLEMAGLLSISLGVLNLLPIPPLDGGQMVIAFAELLRGGRRLSMKVQQGVATVGFFLIVLLMVGASAVDLGRQTEQPAAPVTAPEKP